MSQNMFCTQVINGGHKMVAISCKQGVHRSMACGRFAEIMAPTARTRHITSEGQHHPVCFASRGACKQCSLCVQHPRTEVRLAIMWLMCAA